MIETNLRAIQANIEAEIKSFDAQLFQLRKELDIIYFEKRSLHAQLLEVTKCIIESDRMRKL